jgi:hypothetical protein
MGVKWRRGVTNVREAAYARERDALRLSLKASDGGCVSALIVSEGACLAEELRGLSPPLVL